MAYATLGKCDPSTFALFTLNRNVFSTFMDKQNRVSEPLVARYFSKSMSRCYNSSDPEERKFEAYVRMLLEDPATPSSVQILCYMVDPTLGSDDELVLLGIKDRNEIPIRAVLEKGQFTREHVSIVHEANTASAKLIEAIDKELPRVDLSMRYREKGPVIVEFMSLLARGTYWIQEDLVQLMVAANTVGCITFLLKFDVIEQNFLHIQEFLETLPASLHYMFKRSPSSIAFPGHIKYVVKNYGSGQYSDLVDRLLQELSPEMRMDVAPPAVEIELTE
jgi:hypothetical protein